MSARTPRRSSAHDAVLVGIDTGGTFTDLVVRERAGVRVHKILSTPDDPARAVLAGLATLFPGGAVGRITYGSTVATNALLERRGARVCLVTTRGFEDVIEIGRQARPVLYALEPRPPRPLVVRTDRIGTRERLRFDGRTLDALTARELGRIVRLVRARRPEAIAVAFLHAYANPRHERAAGRALARLGVPISLSSALSREHREYERTSTTVVNAYVAPVMDRHLARLAARLRRGRVLVMQSSGGTVTPAVARREPVRTILSGPAGGVVGAARVAACAGLTRVLTLDMGGTSTDVALLDGALPLRREWTVDGLAVRVPAIDIHTVGAGGGSIARRDAGGVLAVGPESAGADPGPACYGHGEAPTVTDANVVLGRLAASHFLGGRMRLDAERAADAIDTLARTLGLSRLRTAEGVVRVANAAMARALRVVSVERGHDPRAFTLLAFGGAAGLHACELADALGMRDVLVPADPGLLSAHGMAEARLSRDDAITVRAVDPSTGALERMLAPVARRAVAALRAQGARGTPVVSRFAQVRYLGQSHEIEVALGTDYRAAFERSYARLYGAILRGRPIEVLALRSVVSERRAGPRQRRTARPRPRPAPAASRHRLVWSGRHLRVPRYQRERLAPGTRLRGPALLVEYSSTVLLPPDWHAHVDGDRHLRLRRAD